MTTGDLPAAERNRTDNPFAARLPAGRKRKAPDPYKGNPAAKALAVVLWILAAGVYIFFAALPTRDPVVQIIIGYSGILALIVVKVIAEHTKQSRFLRMLAIVIAMFVGLRYMLWRSFYTLPHVSFNDWQSVLNWLPGFLLYAAELYAFFMYMLSTFVVLDPVERAPVKLPEDPALVPTVDVFVPSYNEDEELLQTTLIACKQMRYPADKINIYLLDDGGTESRRQGGPRRDPELARNAQRRYETLQKLCDRLGVIYLTRARNDKAKAGNINAAFRRTTGDLIAIFDADHVPAPNFLERTCGYFARDPKLFLVQTPHFFINPDPLENNLETFQSMPSENEMFYGVVQRGLDKWNGTFFCGSAAVLQRAALMENNGFEGDSVTEDCETALELHAKGFRSLYVDEPLVAGLQPETFNSFIGQRSRWAQGMMQIFLLKNPMLKPGLSFPQRLCYLSNNMFWLFAYARLTFFIAPLFYLFLGLQIYNASDEQFIAYTVPHLVASILLQNLLYGTVRWSLVSELYEYVQSMYLARAISQVMLRPRKPRFLVTAKGETQAEYHVSPLAAPLQIMVGLLLLGVAATVLRYFLQPDNQGITLVVGFWNVFNLLIALAGLGVVVERRQIRRTPRLPRRRPARMLVDGAALDGTIDDLSLGGARMLLPVGAVQGRRLVGETVVLEVPAPGTGEPLRFNVRVQHMRPGDDAYALGLKFQHAGERQVVDGVRLFYGDAREWRRWQEERRQKAPGTIEALTRFFILSFRYGFKALGFMARNTGRRHKPQPNRAKGPVAAE